MVRTVFLALMLALGAGAPYLGSFLEPVAAVWAAAGGHADPNGATGDAGNHLDPNGAAGDVGSSYDPDGPAADAGNHFDPNG